MDGQPIDDTISKRTLKRFNPSELFEITILKNDVRQGFYPNLPQCEIVMLTTKSNAKKQIQVRFAAHSESYAQYLQSHGDDNHLVYLLNGKELEGTRDQILKILFDIPNKKIKKVSVVDKYKFSVARSVVLITTKK